MGQRQDYCAPAGWLGAKRTWLAAMAAVGAMLAGTNGATAQFDGPFSDEFQLPGGGTAAFAFPGTMNETGFGAVVNYRVLGHDGPLDIVLASLGTGDCERIEFLSTATNQQTLSIPAVNDPNTAITGEFSIGPIDNSALCPDLTETISVAFGARGVGPEDGTAEIDWVDDEASQIQVSADQGTIDEAASGNNRFSFTVSLSPALNQAVTLNISIGNPSRARFVAGTSQPSGGTIQVPANGSRTVTIEAIDDAIDHTGQGLGIAITGQDGTVFRGQFRTIDLTIIDNDTEGPTHDGPAPSAPIVDIMPTAVRTQVGAIMGNAVLPPAAGGGATQIGSIAGNGRTLVAQRQLDDERLALDAYNRTADDSQIQIGAPEASGGIDTASLVAMANDGLAVISRADGGSGVWVHMAYDELDRSTQAFQYQGNVFSALVGAGVPVHDRLVVGLAAGYEESDLDTHYNDGFLRGSGVIVAPYAALRLTDTLTARATVGVGVMSYDSESGLGVTADFDSRRLFGALEIEGTYRIGRVVLAPSASLLYAVEQVRAYTDSAGVPFGDADYSFGQFGGGLEVPVPFATGSDSAPGTIEPFGFARGEYDFVREADNALIPADVIDEEDAALVLGGGLRWIMADGTRLSIKGRVNDIGRDDLESYTVQGGVVIPLD